jgi:hypothetical protein
MEKYLTFDEQLCIRDDEIETLQIQLALAREALEIALPIVQDAVLKANASYGQNFRQHWAEKVRSAEDKCKSALYTIDDAKLLDGYVLCDGEPVGVVKGAKQNSIFKTIDFLVQAGSVPNGTPLYARRKP